MTTKTYDGVTFTYQPNDLPWPMTNERYTSPLACDVGVRSGDECFPFEVLAIDGRGRRACRTFEDAAVLAIDWRESEYKAAKALVTAYDAAMRTRGPRDPVAEEKAPSVPPEADNATQVADAVASAYAVEPACTASERDA